MATDTVTEQQILQALPEIPSDQWQDVLKFIAFLQYQKDAKPKIQPVHELTASDLLNSDIVGLWAEGNDIEDKRCESMSLLSTHCCSDPSYSSLYSEKIHSQTLPNISHTLKLLDINEPAGAVKT